VWTFFDKNGNILRSISYERNLKNGPYTVYDSNQVISFLGHYINDTLQGPFKKYKNGILTEEGFYKNGAIDGKFKEYDENGTLISLSDFNEGVESNEIEINRTVDGKKNGLWQKFDKDGNLIQQEVYLNGELVTNEGKSGTPFQFEKEYYPNGQLKSRYMLKNGYKNGIQTNYDSLGNALAAFSYRNDTLLAKGWFNEDGTKDSLWENYAPNGKINYKGSYKNGKKEGLWIYYFEDGNVEQKGRYKDDLPHGEWLWYYPNGQLRRQENFYKGKYEGEVKDFDENGNLIQDRNYAFNTQEGRSYYFIGDHEEKGEMQNGLREGKWTYYFDGKKKAFVGKYKDGFPEGKHKYWFGNGRRAYVMKYKNGKLHGKMIEYIESGGVNHVYIYKNGKLKTLDGEEIVERKIKN
jgi:antitoxin component YwqK of YwqJK toxin-antitoxin module